MRVKLRERPMPDRLKWLAEKLDQDGEDPMIRFAVSSVLYAIAVELTARIDGDPRG